MKLRNIPTQQPQPLAELISCRPGQVSSMSLLEGDPARSPLSMMLLSFAEGEHVSEEEYFGDTLYLLMEGSARVVMPDRTVELHAGDVFQVSAHVVHAIESITSFKVLQMTLS
ncbi:cupin domain-containing protein [Eggerthellaceae bacterium zg-1084]|uniref:Cupin domain-containing protein n=1 Tax=Berryella wangjianweii TaxID=2734634 RepID=A0A6M8J8M2_9ACTN|nr:cupin domain-containing protein [Berryella wangjianweii]NPD31643.1 cupin domain-containing protein [Berryella wangjianweii]QKF07739.1 cupin domain-containing protein [Berryella wangjianweii]